MLLLFKMDSRFRGNDNCLFVILFKNDYNFEDFKERSGLKGAFFYSQVTLRLKPRDNHSVETGLSQSCQEAVLFYKTDIPNQLSSTSPIPLALLLMINIS